MKKKIVAHLVYSFNVGGLERVIANLIDASQGSLIEHCVITQVEGQEMLEQMSSSVTVHCLNKQPGNDIASHIRLFKLLKKIKADVLHTYNFGTLEYQVVAWLAATKVRVHAEHGREDEYEAKIRKRRTFIRKLLLPFIDFFVVVSPDLKAWAESELGVNNSKLRFLLNGIDLKKFHCDRSRSQAEKVRFITVGRLDPIKNHNLLIHAFQQFLSSMSQPERFELSIVGDGDLMSELEKIVEELQLDAQVKLVGNQKNVAMLLREADIFILSSDYEAMPMTILEAMASGLPVISTNVGGVSNIVNDKQNGYLVGANSPLELSKAMQRVAQFSPDVLQVRENGRRTAEKDFSVERMAQEYLNLYGMAI